MDSEDRSTQKDPSSSAVTSSLSHTPGPWEVQKCDGGYRQTDTGDWAIVTDDLITPALVFGGAGWSVGEANARLIAAAPDLLDACLYIVAAGENGDEITAIEKAKAAIAKARSLPAI